VTVFLSVLDYVDSYADIMPLPRSWGMNPTTQMESSVQLKHETVNMVLSADNNHVEALFILLNSGAPTLLTIGWPVAFESDITNLVVKENDQMVQTTYTDSFKYNEEPDNPEEENSDNLDDYEDSEPLKQDEIGIGRWYTWNSKFRTNEEKRIKVSYDVAPLSRQRMIGRLYNSGWFDGKEEKLLGPRFSGYFLHTGKPWKGLIESAQINLFLKGLTKAHVRYFCPGDAVLTGDSLRWSFHNIDPVWNEDFKNECTNFMVRGRIPPHLIREDASKYDIRIVYNPLLTLDEEIKYFEDRLPKEQLPHEVIFFSQHLITLYRLDNREEKIIPLQMRTLKYLADLPSKIIIHPETMRRYGKHFDEEWDFSKIDFLELESFKEHIYHPLLHYSIKSGDLAQFMKIREAETTFWQKLPKHKKIMYDQHEVGPKPVPLPIDNTAPDDSKHYIGRWDTFNSLHHYGAVQNLNPDGTFETIVYNDNKLLTQFKGRWRVKNKRFIWLTEKPVESAKVSESDINPIVKFTKDRFVIQEMDGSLSVLFREN